MSICLATGALAVTLGRGEITLGWRHSVQKTLWEEVWRETPKGLEIVEARIESSGATADWHICIGGACKPMGAYLPADADPVTLKVCE